MPDRRPEAGPAGFFALTHAREDLFVVRSWNRHDGVEHPIRPREPVPGAVRPLIGGGMPVPHDGALLAWVSDSQVTAMLAAHSRPPEPEPKRHRRERDQAGQPRGPRRRHEGMKLRPTSRTAIVAAALDHPGEGAGHNG